MDLPLPGLTTPLPPTQPRVPGADQIRLPTQWIGQVLEALVVASSRAREGQLFQVVLQVGGRQVEAQSPAPIPVNTRLMVQVLENQRLQWLDAASLPARTPAMPGQPAAPLPAPIPVPASFAALLPASGSAANPALPTTGIPPAPPLPASPPAGTPATNAPSTPILLLPPRGTTPASALGGVSASPQPVASAPLPVGLQPQVRADALREALPLSVPLPQAFARLQQLLQQAPNAVPREILRLLERLPAALPRPVDLASPPRLEAAVARSGLFMEAGLARLSAAPASPLPPPGQPGIPRGDMLLQPTRGEPVTGRIPTVPIPLPLVATLAADVSPDSLPPDLKQAVMHALQALLLPLGLLTPTSPQAPNPGLPALAALAKWLMQGSGNSPLPPTRRDGASSTGIDDTGSWGNWGREVVRQLAGALANLQAQQLAHFAQPADPQQPPPPVLALHLPWRDGDQLRQCQINIHRDGHRPGQENPVDRQWVVSLSLELATHSTLHARLRLQRRELRATLWASDATLLGALERHREPLRQRLAAGGLDVAQIDCLPGEPTEASTRVHSRLVDVRT